MNCVMRTLRMPVLVVLFASAAIVEAARLSSLCSLSNSDLWWHLSSGLWILHHHALPHNALFSQSSTNRWVASSWGYDVLLAGIYELLKLRAIPAMLMGLKTLLAFVIFLLAGGFRGKFWPAVALSALVQYILGHAQPLPVYFSIVLFAIEFFLLFETRRRNNVGTLFWLLPLFLLWANLDDQFVYGIGLLILFSVTTSVEQYVSRQEVPRLLISKSAIPLFLSLLATLATPYFYRSYEIFFSTVSSAANPYLPDFKSLSFRQPQDFLFLLLFMSAFLALGSRHSRDIFPIALLIACASVSFYSQRAAWLTVIASVAVVADAIPELPNTEHVSSPARLATAGITLLIVAGTIFLRIPRDHNQLLAKIGQNYPVHACDFIRQNHLPQPLFNEYQWGGFLTWYLPEYPVAVDGRNDLYGDDVIIQYLRVMNADLPYTMFPQMTQAKTLLMQKKSIMADAMSTLPNYKVVYSDDVSVVLTKRDLNSSQETASRN